MADVATTEDTGPADPGPTEPELWRVEQLIAAGWDDDRAILIACSPSVDLHRACDILTNGCDRELAWEILT